MDKKRLVLFGTRHYSHNRMPREISEALASVIEKFHPQLILEEWSTTKAQSAASAIADSKNLRWENIGTSALEEFWTYPSSGSDDFPIGVVRYGPVLNQDRREGAMCDKIAGAMASVETALAVIGLAHLHSMCSKLSNDFDVDAYAFAPEIF